MRSLKISENLHDSKEYLVPRILERIYIPVQKEKNTIFGIIWNFGFCKIYLLI